MYWQIASLILEVVQLGLHLAGLNHYKGKLEDFAGELCDWADDDKAEYLALRASDPDFYDYYKTLPDKQICQSAINRGKGAAFHGYGAKMRRALKTTRGYTPMVKVHLNNTLSQDAIAQTHLTRTVTAIKERRLHDSHILERWSNIVSAPVGVERYNSGASSAIIQQSFTNLKSLGRGFNSAGAAFGTTLYGILNND